MMKILWGLSAAVALAWSATPAAAQVGDDEKKQPPSEVPIDRTPKNVTAEVVLKHYWKSGEKRAFGLKEALEKLKAVKSVDLPADSRKAVVTFTGLCSQYVSLEATALSAGFPALVLSHVHVPAVLKPQKGGDVKGAIAGLGQVEGVTEVTPGESAVLLHADLEKLAMEDLKSTAAKYNCEIVVSQTFEFMRFKIVEGDPAAFMAEADLIKGVMTARDEGEGLIGMWIHKGHLKMERLEKLPGFKIEKQ